MGPPEIEEASPSFGTKRCGVVYKDSEAETILAIRQKSAELIDLIKTHEINRTEASGETVRLYSLAYTEIENGCMWGIKAVTK